MALAEKLGLGYTRRQISVSLESGIVVETGRNIFRRKPVKKIAGEIEDQISQLPHYLQDQARVEAAVTLETFALGTGARVVTKTATGGALVFAGGLTAVLLSNPVGWGILGATAAVAAGRVVNEGRRTKSFHEAAKKIAEPLQRMPSYGSFDTRVLRSSRRRFV